MDAADNYGDLAEFSSLYLMSEVLTEKDKKTIILRWSVNHYGKLNLGIRYVSDYICIGKKKNRLFLVRHDTQTEDPASSMTKVHLLLGLFSYSEIYMSCHILGEYNTRFDHDEALTPSFKYYRGKLFCAFEEIPQITPRAKLTVMCKLIISMNENEDSYIHFPLQDKEKFTNMSTDFEQLFQTGKFTDTSIIVRDKIFQVHRVILGGRSSVFAAMLEHKMKENLENKITIEDSDSESFGELLRYIYTGKTRPLNHELAMPLLSLADKYDVQQLKREMAKFLLVNLSLDNALDILILADLHNEAELKDSATEFVVDHLGALMKTPEWLSFHSHIDLVDDILQILAEQKTVRDILKDFRPSWKEPDGSLPLIYVARLGRRAIPNDRQ